MHINVIPTTTKTLEELTHRQSCSNIRTIGGIYCKNVDQYQIQIWLAAVLINGIRDQCMICQKHPIYNITGTIIQFIGRLYKKKWGWVYKVKIQK